MDNRKVFLDKNRGIKSRDKDTFLGVDLVSNSRLLPYDSVSDILNLNTLYNDERDNCHKYRVILTVNPICSNVLFNSRTEIVRYEGSDDCKLIIGNNVGEWNSNTNAIHPINTTPFNWMQGIRDTEYTHPKLYEDSDPCVYHCGFDIFNNHRLRTNEFIYINRTKEADKRNFNTLSDYVRNNDGERVSETVSPSSTNEDNRQVHIYQYDTIKSMYDAYIDGLKEKDGWYGFNNNTDIAIPNATISYKTGDKEDISINRIMNNNKSCEMIDLYPDRSLYSFIPKVNKYRHRIEKNWDYCLTYPYKIDKEMLNTITGGEDKLKIIQAIKSYTPNGNITVRFKTLFKHNFKIGDYISLFYKSDDEIMRYPKKVRIVSVGDYDGNYAERYFSIAYIDVNTYFTFNDSNIVVEYNSTTPVQFFYKRTINGLDCEYYFRKFKKIKLIDGNELTSVVNKLAYGENIYGDRVGQVVFTDDVDVTGLVDHRGRPVSEIYFTVIKRNKGHEEWYDNNVYNTSDIEFSHCFSKVTSGLDLPEDVDDYNVRKIHNINISEVTGDYADGANNVFAGLEQYDKLEDDITIDWDEFYGDVVEFNPIDCIETVIEKVYQRFNTAQRETTNNLYYDIFEDTLLYDDYDINVTKDTRGQTVTEFTITSGLTNTTSIINGNELKFPGNLNPEGYFYYPFTKLTLLEEEDFVSKVRGTNLRYNTGATTGTTTAKDIDGNEFQLYTLSLTMPKNYNLIKGDVVGIYDSAENSLDWLTINKVNGLDVEFVGENLIDVDKINDRTYYITKTNESVPSYAVYLPSSHSFAWRGLVHPSELSTSSSIFNRPFANGCFYIEDNVNLFLKRQDPVGEYGLLNYGDTTRIGTYKVYGWDKIDFENTKYNNGELTPICY